LALFCRRAIVTLAACLARLVTFRNPLAPIGNWIRETRSRGMNSWYDLVDWVGGWPFEVARPEQIFRFMRDRGFVLQEMTTSGGHGCNEFVFQRDPSE
jgi:2-polyprenyl-6-hydroxyphenyl methylase/3-demethylubiquinone-9 3-methyltransferase